jgi:hypothetical protein
MERVEAILEPPDKGCPVAAIIKGHPAEITVDTQYCANLPAFIRNPVAFAWRMIRV